MSWSAPLPLAEPPARFPALTRVGLAAAGYTLATGSAVAAWHHVVGTAPFGLALAVCLAPALLAIALALTAQADRRQYVVRLVAVALMGPIGVLFWSLDGPTRPGLGMALAIGFALLHVLAFVLAVRWLGAFTTRIDPDAGTLAVGRAMLVRRLASLQSLGLPLEIRPDGASSAGLRITWHPSAEPERRHVVQLVPDEANREVTVREWLQADGAAPADADEASLRGPGEPAFDPARPDAQRVWLRTVQTTLLDAQRLQALPLALHGDRVAWSGGTPALPDTDTLMALLARIVTRSGWAWCPRLG
ncbi:MAG: hypothetical protein KF788_15145 [Piscinibacter sp.]|nr:hypothetical protein [Piscinibacter sp.]